MLYRAVQQKESESDDCGTSDSDREPPFSSEERSGSRCATHRARGPPYEVPKAPVLPACPSLHIGNDSAISPSGRGLSAT